MANSLELGKAEMWASMVQTKLYENFVGKMITDTKFEGSFNGNKTIHFTRIAKINIQDLATSYTPLTPQDVNVSDETFELNKRKGFLVEISDEDYIEMKISPNSDILKDVAEKFAKAWDTEIMKEYANAGDTIDDGDLENATGAGDGDPMILTKANIYDMFTAISEKMDTANIGAKDRFIVITPAEKRLIAKSPDLVKETNKGDKIVTGGFMGSILGIDIYYSNNMQTVSGVKHLLAGQGKPICFGTNIKPKIGFISSAISKDDLNYIKGRTKFGIKTFSEGSEKLFDVLVKV